MTKLLTHKKSFCFSETQIKSLDILEQHGVNISQFVRMAIHEKIKREWKNIKEEKNKFKCPF
jgi:hypothetical protein